MGRGYFYGHSYFDTLEGMCKKSIMEYFKGSPHHFPAYQKKCGPPFFSARIFFWQFFFWSQIFFRFQFFLAHFFFPKKKIRPKKNFGPTTILAQKFFWQNFFWVNNFFFWSKFFLSKIYFRLKFFFVPNKFFWPKQKKSLTHKKNSAQNKFSEQRAQKHNKIQILTYLDHFRST